MYKGVLVRAVLMGTKCCKKILNVSTRFSCRRFRNALYGEKILLMGKCFVWAWFRQTGICSSMRGIQNSKCRRLEMATYFFLTRG